jgi:hypothetical protein
MAARGSSFSVLFGCRTPFTGISGCELISLCFFRAFQVLSARLGFWPKVVVDVRRGRAEDWRNCGWE